MSGVPRAAAVVWDFLLGGAVRGPFCGTLTGGAFCEMEGLALPARAVRGLMNSHSHP